MAEFERGEGLTVKEQSRNFLYNRSSNFSDDKILKSSNTPTTEQEKDKRVHIDEINYLQQKIDTIEKITRTLNDEPSRKSLESSIKIMKDSQGKLRNSLYTKYGINEFGEMLDADRLTKLRERVAVQGVGAVERLIIPHNLTREY
jgi:hypothetical protein